ncbi:hypothetical protein PAE9249_01678 [Paenibacillus sp. CECT 9249]|nr:hypothetical protein PAE9249_01678 [Paenibacillus sp. CECT 9249]
MDLHVLPHICPILFQMIGGFPIELDTYITIRLFGWMKSNEQSGCWIEVGPKVEEVEQVHTEHAKGRFPLCRRCRLCLVYAIDGDWASTR